MNIISIADSTIKPALNGRQVYKINGDTNDIITAILKVDLMHSNDTKVFAQYLKGKTTEETIYNVWYFVKMHIKYVLDPIGFQYVKTPSRTWQDGYSDCKSRSIFQASIFKNLGIPFAFRFASYDESKIYTHVYVVAKPKGVPNISDPDMPDFNEQKKATATLDKNYMSQIEILSGTGDDLDFQHHKPIGEMTPFDYDIAITKHGDKIAKALHERDRGVGSLKAERYQDRIDMADAMIDISKDDSLSGEEKTRGIGVILEMIDKGHFDHSDSVSGIGDLRQRFRLRSEANAHRIKHAKKLVKSGYKPYIGKISLKNIVKKAASSFSAVTKKIATVAKKAILTPLQLPFKASLEVLLPKMAPFFLYLFIKNQNTIKTLPPKVRKKRNKQEKIAKLIIGAVGMKEDHFMGLLRNGITKHYGKSPEVVLATMVKGPISGVGIIDDIIKVVFAVIKQIAKLFKKRDPDAESATADDAPSPSDFADMSMTAKNAVIKDAHQTVQSQQAALSPDDTAPTASAPSTPPAAMTADDTAPTTVTPSAPTVNTSAADAAADTDNAAAAEDLTSSKDDGTIPTVNRKQGSIC